MRLELFYNPRLLCERIAEISVERRRLKRLRHTPGSNLHTGHIDSLELLELLRAEPPKVVYDIGAYIGTWTVLVKSLFPNCEVHAFEPLAAPAEEFCQRTRQLKKIHLHRVALGTRAERKKMKLASSLDSSSMLEMAAAQSRHFHVYPAGEEPVRVERLDDYCREKALPWPDVMKLDVQGYELEVLRGAIDCLAQTKAIISEVSFIELYKGQCLFGHLVSFLAEHDFHLRAFGVNTKLGVGLLQTDVLFEKRRTSIGSNLGSL